MGYLAVAAVARLATEGTPAALTLLALDWSTPAFGGLILAAAQLPHVVAGPLVGELADRASAPRVIYAGAMVLFAVGIGTVAVTIGRVHDVVPLALAAVTGLCAPLLAGGLTSLLPDLVPAATLTRAYTLDGMTYNGAGIVAPAAVGAVALAGSSTLATLLLAALIGFGALATAGLAISHRDRRPGRQGLGLRVVFKAMWSRPALRATTLATTVSHVGFGAVALGSALLAPQLGRPHAFGGALLAAFAAGALVASVGIARYPVAKLGSPPSVATSLLGMGVACAGAAFAPSDVVAAAMFFVAGAFDAPLLTATQLVRTAEAPVQLRTQVFTTGASLKMTAAAGGAALAGAMAPTGGRTILATVSVVQLLAAAVALLAGSSYGAGAGVRTLPPWRRSARRRWG